MPVEPLMVADQYIEWVKRNIYTSSETNRVVPRLTANMSDLKAITYVQIVPQRHHNPVQQNKLDNHRLSLQVMMTTIVN